MHLSVNLPRCLLLVKKNKLPSGEARLIHHLSFVSSEIHHLLFQIKFSEKLIRFITANDQLVVGDVYAFEAGMKFPADSVVIQGADVLTNEVDLTGESD